jgi:hypothetical protein
MRVYIVVFVCNSDFAIVISLSSHNLRYYQHHKYHHSVLLLFLCVIVCVYVLLYLYVILILQLSSQHLHAYRYIVLQTAFYFSISETLPVGKMQRLVFVQ